MDNEIDFYCTPAVSDEVLEAINGDEIPPIDHDGDNGADVEMLFKIRYIARSHGIRLHFVRHGG